MVLRHISRAENYFKRVEAAEAGANTAELQAVVAALEADRDRLVARIESLEAIVTSEDYDLEREARAAGIEAALLDAPPATGRSASGTRVRG